MPPYPKTCATPAADDDVGAAGVVWGGQLIAPRCYPRVIAICIGIPVAAVLALALLVCMALAWVAVGHLVGERLLKWLQVSTTPLLEALAGVAVISALASVPCLGTVAAILALSWGLGAVVLTRFGTRLDPIWS